MKTLTTLLAATLLAAGFNAQAQTTATTVTKSETTAPATTEVTGASVATEGAATTEPTLSPAAMRARAMTSHGARGHSAALRTKSTPGFKDGVTVRDGKVVATQSGHSTVLDSTATMKLITGLEASGTGVVTRPDGTTETLHEGDYITITGRFESAQERKDHAQSLKENLKEDRKVAAKKARSPLRQIANNF